MQIEYIRFKGAGDVKAGEIAVKVDGLQWTVGQTMQAVRDGAACGCGSCVCCRLRSYWKFGELKLGKD